MYESICLSVCLNFSLTVLLSLTARLISRSALFMLTCSAQWMLDLLSMASLDLRYPIYSQSPTHILSLVLPLVCAHGKWPVWNMPLSRCNLLCVVGPCPCGLINVIGCVCVCLSRGLRGAVAQEQGLYIWELAIVSLIRGVLISGRRQWMCWLTVTFR